MGNMGRKGYREAEEGMPERDSARPAEILRTEHLRKVYGTGNNEIIAVNDAGISVAQGEFVAIVGSSGSGKSTLMHMLGGVDRPTSGRVFIEDEDIYRMDDDKLAIFRRRQVGLIYQFYNLIPVLTVEENLTLPCELDGREPEQCSMTGRCSLQYLVEADGSVYPCDFYMLDEYRLGNFNEDRLEVLNHARENLGFLQRSLKLDPACRQCPYYHLCRGGCQRLRDPGPDGAYYQNYFCRSYRIFFDRYYGEITEIGKQIGKR